jgi:hypothetical protein
MAKITVTLDGTSLQELEITRENAKTTIGRRSGNDVVLTNPAISGEHAVIEAHGNEFFLQDLNSTNGTQVNGQPITRHYLQNGDCIELGKYRINFETGATDGALNHAEPDNSIFMLGAGDAPYPIIRIMNGHNAGKELVLSKVTTSLGSPGIQVVLISRSDDCYFIRHVEGEQPPLINDLPIADEQQQLHHDDVIELSGTQLLFSVA